MKKTYAICYNTLHVFNHKKDAISFFKECCDYCDPNSSEFSRYASILVDLLFSNIGKDNVDNSIYEIMYEDTKEKVKLDKKINYNVLIKKIESELN